jgi:hypothetical protein
LGLNTALSSCLNTPQEILLRIFIMTNIYNATHEKDIQKVNKDMQKIGHSETLAKIQKTSRIALCNFPTDKEINEFPIRGRRVINRIGGLLQAGSKCEEWEELQLVAFLNDLSWGVAVADAVTEFMMLDNNNGGAGGSDNCATKCRREYDNCVNMEGCDTDCWICLCESACSLVYISCMTKCLVSNFQGGGGVFG